MTGIKCDSCGANVDLAKDSAMGHCATCNKIVEIKQPPKEDKEAESKADNSKAKEEVKK